MYCFASWKTSRAAFVPCPEALMCTIPKPHDLGRYFLAMRWFLHTDRAEQWNISPFAPPHLISPLCPSLLSWHETPLTAVSVKICLFYTVASSHRIKPSECHKARGCLRALSCFMHIELIYSDCVGTIGL